MRSVALVVSAAGNGDRTWDLQDSIILVDQFGLVYTRFYYDRSVASKSAYPELKNRVHPGETKRGVIVFEIPGDSSIDVIALVPNQDQFIVLGGGIRLDYRHAGEVRCDHRRRGMGELGARLRGDSRMGRRQLP